MLYGYNYWKQTYRFKCLLVSNRSPLKNSWVVMLFFSLATWVYQMLQFNSTESLILFDVCLKGSNFRFKRDWGFETEEITPLAPDWKWIWPLQTVNIFHIFFFFFDPSDELTKDFKYIKTWVLDLRKSSYQVVSLTLL